MSYSVSRKAPDASHSVDATTSQRPQVNLDRVKAILETKGTPLKPSHIDSNAPPLSPNEGGGLTPQGTSPETVLGQLNASPAVDTIAPVVDAPVTDDPRLMELAKRESMLRAESKKLAQEKAELESLRSKPTGLTADEWKAKFLADPASVGMTYQEMADRYLNQPSEQDQKYSSLENKIKELESKLVQGTGVLEQAQQKAYSNAINQMTAETRRLVASRSDEFEAVASAGDAAIQEVVASIQSEYEATGILMSVQEAAQKVEDRLLADALKYAGLKKVREKMIPASTQEVVSPQTAPSTTKNTISHSMVTAGKPLTKEDRIAKAIAAFNASKTK